MLAQSFLIINPYDIIVFGYAKLYDFDSQKKCTRKPDAFYFKIKKD